MADIFKAKPVVQALHSKMQEDIMQLEKENIQPTLGIIRVGSRPDDIAYENSVIKNCESMGVKGKVFELDQSITMSEFKTSIEKVNGDSDIHGILLFRPLPEQLIFDEIKYLIRPEKDIDCMNPVNLAKVFEGAKDGFPPCTPEAVVEILKHYQVPLVGANVVIVNSSLVVGKPLGMLLLKEKATVTICNSKTRNLADITSKADIVVAATGKGKMFGEGYFSENNVVIDVGINDAGDGKICGDVDYEMVWEKVKAITPVPGGVGTVTTAILIQHVIEACKKQKGM